MLLVNPDSISSLIISDNEKFVSLHSYHLPQDAGAETTAIHLKQILSHENVLKNEVMDTHVVYGYPSAIMAPADMVNETSKKMMMELVYGELADTTLKTDDVQGSSIKTVYTVPKQVDSVISYLFSSDTGTHLYSLLPGIEGLYDDYLYCIFGSCYFTVMLIKAGKLQMIQTYHYKTPEDVAYYLLQVCQSFEMNTSEIRVDLNGMISASSNLYNGISKYFLNLEFGGLPQGFEYPDTIEDYPPHYFSHILALAKCVS